MIQSQEKRILIKRSVKCQIETKKLFNNNIELYVQPTPLFHCIHLLTVILLYPFIFQIFQLPF